MDEKKLKELQRLKTIAKLGSSPIKSPDYISPLEQDVMRIKGESPEMEPVTKIKNTTSKIDTKQITPILSGDDFSDKIAKLRALKAAGKKVAGIVPFAGAGMAALSGDPAMAAEETIMDLPGVEALRSEDVGESPEEEAIMLAERDAMEKYKSSPARLAKLKALMGRND